MRSVLICLLVTKCECISEQKMDLVKKIWVASAVLFLTVGMGALGYTSWLLFTVVAIVLGGLFVVHVFRQRTFGFPLSLVLVMVQDWVPPFYPWCIGAALNHA